LILAIHGSTTQAFWVGTAYLLASAVTMHYNAALSNIFGRATCYLASLASFTMGAIICSLSHDLTLMLVGRVIQGVGGGGILILTLIIYTDIVPLRYLGQYYGIVQGAWALGTVIGPIVSLCSDLI
jgi:MFS family permease